MGYLILNDYKRVIQTKELNAITTLDDSIRMLVEGSIQTEINEYLIQRWDTTQEFTDTNVFDPTVIYKANNRVYLDAPAYSATSTYALGKLTLQAGVVYSNTTAIVVPEVFTPSHWAKLGNQYDMFYVTLPQPLFNQDTFYYKLDKVFWKDKVYTAQRDSIMPDQQDRLQLMALSDIRRGNITPDDRFAQPMWGTGVPYALTVGVLPTDTTKWTKGDNRNQSMVNLYMDMVVYELSKRIAPNNVPEVRHNKWVAACKRLKDFAAGNLNAQLPQIQPKTGQRVRYGGSPYQDLTF